MTPPDASRWQRDRIGHAEAALSAVWATLDVWEHGRLPADPVGEIRRIIRKWHPDLVAVFDEADAEREEAARRDDAG